MQSIDSVLEEFDKKFTFIYEDRGREDKRTLKPEYMCPEATCEKIKSFLQEKLEQIEVEARIDELKNFTTDLDYPLFKKAKERIVSMVKQLDERCKRNSI